MIESDTKGLWGLFVQAGTIFKTDVERILLGLHRQNVILSLPKHVHLFQNERQFKHQPPDFPKETLSSSGARLQM